MGRPTRIPRHIRVQTPRMLEEAANTLPAAGARAAKPIETRPVFIAAQEYTSRMVPVGAGESVLIAPANPNRRYFFVVNETVNGCRVAYGQPATATVGINLATTGAFHEPLIPPAGSINAFSAVGTTLQVIEG